jgi:hypothetical protein
MAVILFLGAPIFLALIFLSASFYYRSRVIRCQQRLQRMWVESMRSNKSTVQRVDVIDLFFDRKDNQFKPLRTAKEDTYTVKSS